MSILTRIQVGPVAVCAIMLGCGSSGDIVDPPPPEPVFSSLRLLPTDAILFTLEPQRTVQLAATAMDQLNRPMTVPGAPTFSSSAETQATVSATGLVTAHAEGTAVITASLTANGVTHTRAMGISVVEAPPSASVTAPNVVFNPQIVDISVGGTVTWTFFTVPHNVTFSAVSGAPANLSQFSEGSASRTFTTSGVFPYQCTIHAGMTGTVQVH